MWQIVRLANGVETLTIWFQIFRFDMLFLTKKIFHFLKIIKA